jgi:Recombinase
MSLGKGLSAAQIAGESGQPSAICLISALPFYHLTDVIPKKTWVLGNANKITTQKDIRLWRRRNPNWNVGIKPIDGLAITSVDRTSFGYRCLRGRLICDAREIEIVQLVMNLWTAGQSYSAIAKHLNNQGIKNRKATPWDHSHVRSIVERHKDKPLVLEEE